MKRVDEALRAGLSDAPVKRAATRSLLVAGGGGALGSAVLERALGSRRFAPVTALCVRPMGVALQGLQVHPVPASDPYGATPPAADTAIVVFDRERGRHGREAAFLRPEPSALPALARWLHAGGTRRLVVVLPHAPSSLPQALRLGLASLDEQAVAALGLEQLVFVRSAGATGPVRLRGSLQRLAHALLSQLHFMVPQREQPVRPVKVAEFALALAASLDTAPPGTRVAPPELVWLSAQVGATAVVSAWLEGGPLPQARVSPRRW